MGNTKLFAFILLLGPLAWGNPILESCKKDASSCASLDIDHPRAKEAYEMGCQARDAYSCYRLGQYFEVRAFRIPAAIEQYGQSCKFGYKDGCADEKNLRSHLCYLKKQRAFCKGEPEGEFKIFVFLETLNPKYKNAFYRHNFSTGLQLEEVRKLYRKRLAERNTKLLEALKLSLINGRHDADDAESLQQDILVLEGKEKPGHDDM